MEINIKQIVREYWAFNLSEKYINYPIINVEFKMLKRFISINNNKNYLYIIKFNYYNKNKEPNYILHYCFISNNDIEINNRKNGLWLDKKYNANIDLNDLIKKSNNYIEYIKI